MRTPYRRYPKLGIEKGTSYSTRCTTMPPSLHYQMIISSQVSTVTITSLCKFPLLLITCKTEALVSVLPSVHCRKTLVFSNIPNIKGPSFNVQSFVIYRIIIIYLRKQQWTILHIRFLLVANQLQCIL